MEQSDKTARQLYEEIKANPTRKRFGFGRKPALINVDLQKAYTCVGEFVTAYETDPKQLDYVNTARAICSARRTARWSGPMSPTWSRARIAASGARAPTRPTRCRTSRWARAAPSSTTASEVDRQARHRRQQADGLGLLRDQPGIALHISTASTPWW